MLDKQQLVAAALALSEELAHAPNDAHEIQLRLRQMIDQLRATGMPIPDELARLESQLDSEFEGGSNAPGRPTK